MGKPDQPEAASDAENSTADLAKTLPAESANIGLAKTVGGPATPKLADGANFENGMLAERFPVTVPGTLPAALANWDRYDILRPLGEGGMGTVFLARDRRLGRLVGLKFLRLPSPDAAERMMQEARAQARLDHKGICKVFEVGDFHGQPYIAMEYLDGQPLYAAHRHLTLEQKVVLLIEISMAVHAAHCQGVLHRDLKPANIMVCTTSAEESGQAPGELRPVLMDFGLARDSLAAQRLTQTGMIMGTPQYMAPEQARGYARHLDRRADVYSLGAVLYELLTGRPPFHSTSEVELLLAVLDQDPPSPRLLEPGLPADLEVIALKCLRKEPERRYESALALAEDLRRYLRGEPIAARPASAPYRLRRLVKRHLAAVAVIAVIFCSLVALLGVAVHARAKEQVAARRADEQRRLAGKLGQSVARMNLFLRVAYSLPVHDLQRERGVVLTQLHDLEAQSTGGDSFLRGTLEGAIGQGYLALQDDARAKSHLELALRFAEATPDVYLALGQALGRLHDQEASDIRRRFQGEQAKLKLDELRQKYLVPALKQLKRGKASTETEPLYVQALIHYYNGEAEYEQALNDARQAHKAAPWLIEPLALEAKILSQRYIEQLRRQDRQAIKQLGVVREMIERAIGIAASYPEFYSSFADVAAITLRMKYTLNLDLKELEPLFVAGVRHAERAMALLPESAEGYDQLSEILAQWAYAQIGEKQDPQATVKQTLAAVDKALAMKPERARPYFARARAYLALGIYQKSLDIDTQPSSEQAASDCRRTTALDPNNADNWILLMFALADGADAKIRKELPVDQDFADIEEAGKRAAELRPDLPTPKVNLAVNYIVRAKYSIYHGRDPSADLANAHQLLDGLLQKNPQLFGAKNNRLLLLQEDVRHSLNTRDDSVAKARESLAEAQRFRREYPTFTDAVELEAQAYAELGDALLQQGASPMQVVQAGLAALASAGADALAAGKLAQLRCELFLRQADWLAANKRSPEPALQAILQATAQLDQLKGGMQSELWALRAKALRLRSAWLLSQRQSQAALAAADAGLAVCAISRKNAREGLLPCKIEEGVLIALKAQLVRSPAERAALAESAVSALRALIKDQPPLERELGRYLQSSLALSASPLRSGRIPLRHRRRLCDSRLFPIAECGVCEQRVGVALRFIADSHRVGAKPRGNRREEGIGDGRARAE